MSRAFSLHVPADAPFEVLAGDVARRFAEMAGASESEAETFGSEVESGVHALTATGSGAQLAFESGPTGLEVSISDGSHTRVIRRTLPPAGH